MQLVPRDRAADQPRHHDLRARALDPAVALQVDDQPLEVARCPRVRTRAIASASPVTLHASTTSGCSRSVAATSSSVVPGAAEQLHQRLGVPPERAVVDDRREPLERPSRPQPVDPPLHRRRRQPHPLADVAERPPAIFLQQRKNLPINRVHTQDYCADMRTNSIDTHQRDL